MSNIITIELCAEDRARLDRLSAALEAHLPQVVTLDAVFAKKKAADAAPAEAAQDAATEPETEAPKNDTPAAEETPQAEPEPAAEPEKVPTAEELQAIVQELAAPGSPHRAAVRAIVKSYAERVTLIPEDKRTEAMQKLLALKEGKA